MTFALYDFVNAKGENEFAKWTKRQQKAQRTKLLQKLDWLAQHGEGLVPQVLTDTHLNGIRKIRVHGQVALRPLLCNGPAQPGKEYTMLMGAKEVGDAWDPVAAPEKAAVKKEEVAADTTHRRVKHERIIT